jgi:Asp-tRNA(Asn)/Glu-tRNA(Gln) amidotransferase C subunit
MKESEIRKEARDVLDKFAVSLGKVKTKEKELKREVGGFREEREGGKADEDFRKLLFENAPHKKGDFIVSEKKKW